MLFDDADSLTLLIFAGANSRCQMPSFKKLDVVPGILGERIIAPLPGAFNPRMRETGGTFPAH
jgi:hypothetical protein